TCRQSMQLHEKFRKFADEVYLVHVLQGIPDVRQVEALKAAHNEVGPILQHAIRINLWSSNLEFAIYMLSDSAVRLKQSSVKRWVEFDNILFIHRKDDIRTVGGVRSIAKAHKSSSWQPMSLADHLHRLEPYICVNSQCFIVSAIGNGRQKRFWPMHLTRPF